MEELNPHEPTPDEVDWGWKLDACKRSLCKLNLTTPGQHHNDQTGTGWVVRNDGVAALVTARHVFKHNLEATAEGRMKVTGGATAVFSGGCTVSLAEATGLLAPSDPEGGTYEPPDIMVVVLPAGRRFPVPPVPCLLDVASAGDVGDGGAFTLLHHPIVSNLPARRRVPVVHPPSRLTLGSSSGADPTPAWVVRHSTRTAEGSSGGMLIDHQCRAFAVHRRRVLGEVKEAVLLSVIHSRLGTESPWHDIGEVKHIPCLVFNLPPLSTRFVGRGDALKTLDEYLDTPGEAVVVSAGISGVGKSSLAIKWVHKQVNSGDYSRVAWLRAESVAALEADLVSLGDYLSIPDPWQGKSSRRDRARFVKRQLEWYPDRGVLMVFDNAEIGYRELEAYVPTGDRCRCIFTARDRAKFPSESVVPLGPFTTAEALELLRQESGRDINEDLNAATALCAEVGQLPLAVKALGAYTRDTNKSFSQVRDELHKSVASAPALNEEMAGYDQKESVVGALGLVCERLDAASRSCLQRLALLAADRVPTELLGAEAETRRLYQFGIVSYPGDGLVSTHRLVQRVVVAQMGADEVWDVGHELVQSLLVCTREIDKYDQTTWGAFRVVVPHAEALLDHLVAGARDGSLSVDKEERRWVLRDRLLDYYKCVSAMPAAKQLATVLLEEAELRLGDAHPTGFTRTHNIAFFMKEQGKYDKALELYRVVERKYVATLEEDHPSVAATRREIAGVLKNQGKYGEALELYRAVERTEVAALGEDHPDVATTRHNIAWVLESQGKYGEALALYRAVERTEVAALGEDHPEVATTRHNIAWVLKNQGKYGEALALYRAVERMRVAALGEDHPEVATTRHNIAGVLKNQGKYGEALALYRAVERKRVAALGEDHPSLATTRHNIAGVLESQGKHGEALELYRAVERTKVAALGEDHPSLATTRHNIAGVLKNQGKYGEALELYRAVERTEVAALGEDHPDVATTRHNIAWVLESQGKDGEALELYREVERMRVAALGEDHPGVAITRRAVANLDSSAADRLDFRVRPVAVTMAVGLAGLVLALCGRLHARRRVG